jgi:hypothetical protein
MNFGRPVYFFPAGMLSRFGQRQILFAAILLGVWLPAAPMQAGAQSTSTGLPNSLSFSANVGANPRPQSFYASFNAAVTASTNNGGTWLAFSSFSSGGSSDPTLLVGVQVNSQSLTAGSYTGQLTLTPTLGGSAVIVAVNLQVIAAGSSTYSVTPAALQASAAHGSNASSQTISIGGGATVVPQVAATTASGGNWLALSGPTTYTAITTRRSPPPARACKTLPSLFR